MLPKRIESRPKSYFKTILITTDDIGPKICSDVFIARKAFYYELWSIYISR